ncbi:MAG: archaellin/type IV pilin N-terminal domain-containing protein [Candidatus Woesearchaeota archaeon]
MHNKGEMGVGTLIIFIAMLLVAAVAAGVLIQTVGSLQEKSLQTGTQARTQISTNAETVEVSAVDGRDTKVNYFSQLIKLAPGSDPIKLSESSLTFNTKDKTANLIYRGVNGVCERNNATGYYTRKEEVVSSWINITNCYNFTEDIDDDGAYTDKICVADSTHISLNLSSGTALFTISNIGSASTTPVILSYEKQPVSIGNPQYGKITINGTATIDDTIPANAITIAPYHEGEGYFTVVYLQEGTNWVNGNLQRGDLIKLCYEAPQDITEGMEVRINFIPKIGSSTLIEFTTPDVMSTERVYLYP